MNRSRRHALLAPLLAVVALVPGLMGSASAAFNHAATEPHYGNFLLWESEASGFSAYEFADPIKENGEWIYDGALGVPVYVRQNPWTMFDPHGLYQQMPAFLLHSNGIDTTSREYQDGARQGAAAGAMVAGTVAASMAPGVGEAMDAAVIADPKSTPFEKKMAGASLAVNGLTAGFLPNVGGLLRAGRESAGMLAKNGDTVIDTARTTQEATGKAVDAAATPKGGAYKDVPAVGGEVHHMPADSVSPLSKGKGPGARMETGDHRQTASWGSSKEAKAHRQQQKAAIDQGKFKEAQKMDIDDVRPKFGDKYDQGIEQMERYAETLDNK